MKIDMPGIGRGKHLDQEEKSKTVSLQKTTQTQGTHKKFSEHKIGETVIFQNINNIHSEQLIK